MNALQPFVIGFWIPVMGATWYWFNVRSTCYGWREELCDGFSELYRPLEPSERKHIRVTTGDPGSAGMPVEPQAVFGTRVSEGFVTTEETDHFLNELKGLVSKYGRPFSDKFKALMRMELEFAELDPSFIDGMQFVSDLVEDERPSKGTWGAGDSIDNAAVPLPIRRLAARVQEYAPNIGELRHAYVLHSSTGQLCLPLHFMHPFAGHEFVMIPLARQRRAEVQGGVVVTVSPRERSHAAGMRDVVQASWSNKDQDVYLPFRSATRVYGTARFRCQWGIRPTQYFGHPANPLPLDPETFDAKFPSLKPGTWGADTRGGRPATVSTPMHEAGLKNDGSGPGLVARVKRLLTSSATAFENDNDWQKRYPATATAAARTQDRDPETALVLLAFEGPMDKEKTRNKWRRWERYAYGPPPTPDFYARLEDDRPFTQEQVGEWYQIPMWIAMNFWQNSAQVGGS